MNKHIFITLLIFFLSTSAKSGWFQQSSGVSFNLHSVNFNHGNENHAWACGDNGTILYTSNGGINWIMQSSGTNNNLYAIVFMEIAKGPVFACGDNGIILRTSDNGNNWAVIESGVNVTLRDISDFNFITVGDSGVILKSSDNGFNWNRIFSPVQKNLFAVSASFSAYIAGEDGTILRGFNQGTNWNLLTSGITNDLLGVPLFGNTDIAVGERGLILRSTNIGVTWYSQNSMTVKNINSTEYSVNNTSRIYCAGDSGLILKTTDSGNQWWFQNSGSSENLNSIFFYLSDNTGYAVGNNGTILKTTDGGGVMTSIEENNLYADNYSLNQNYPNPFNPSTNIDYEIPVAGHVMIKIYNLNGKEVASLVNEMQNPGKHSITFNANGLPSGLYFLKFISGEFEQVKLMMFLK